MKKAIYVALVLIFGLIIFNQISCSDEVTDTEQGTVVVLVVDNDTSETPIPNIEITLTPINEIKFTDSNGTCNFNVRPGSYYVDAEVCCAGAGNIIFHELINVSENKTTNVKLVGCLSCD
jgi:hypothetical protein